MEHNINLEELLRQADDEIKIIRKKAEENSITIGRAIEGCGCAMQSYIQLIHDIYGRLPNDDEIRAILAITNGVLQFIGVKEAFDLDEHDLIMSTIAMWSHALAKCGFDPENMEGAI